MLLHLLIFFERRTCCCCIRTMTPCSSRQTNRTAATMSVITAERASRVEAFSCALLLQPPKSNNMCCTGSGNTPQTADGMNNNACGTANTAATSTPAAPCAIIAPSPMLKQRGKTRMMRQYSAGAITAPMPAATRHAELQLAVGAAAVPAGVDCCTGKGPHKPPLLNASWHDCNQPATMAAKLVTASASIYCCDLLARSWTWCCTFPRSASSCTSSC